MYPNTTHHPLSPGVVWGDTVATDLSHLMGAEVIVVLRAVIAGVDVERQEGFVIRTAAGFATNNFARQVMKWVRPGHMASDKDWTKEPIVRNGLREGEAA